MRQLSRWATLALLTSAGQAAASGLEIPEQGVRSVARGGAWSAKADDPSAAIHNPGALVLVDGFDLLYSHNLIWHHATFTRAASVLPPGEGFAGQDPLAPVENEEPFFPLGAMFSAAYGFGDWTVGVSAYGPNASGRLKYPVTGGQRYMLTELEALMFYTGVSVAWGGETFGVGATVQGAFMPSMRYSLVVDGTPPPATQADAAASLSPYSSFWDVEATLAVGDAFAPTAIVGLWWQPHPSVEIGLSGRVLPVVFAAEGDIELRNVPGQSEFTPGQLEVTGSAAAVEIPLPATARFGVRYVHREGGAEVFDVELDVVWEGWSIVDAYEADLAGRINLAGGAPVQDVTIDKRWRDTFSVRLGGTAAVVPDFVKLSAGGYFEQGASHPRYTNLDFLSTDRFGVGAGFEFALLNDPDGIQLDFIWAFQHVFQADRTVDEAEGKVIQQRPIAQCPDACGGYTGVVANAGTFSSSFDQLSIGLNARF
ncbi:MAG: outer membrane protein transport protein [Myxococcales bacterium]|nr:outer membrane protein transport protein [Myxococcales bacterium]